MKSCEPGDIHFSSCLCTINGHVEAQHNIFVRFIKHSARSPEKKQIMADETLVLIKYIFLHWAYGNCSISAFQFVSHLFNQWDAPCSRRRMCLRHFYW